MSLLSKSMPDNLTPEDRRKTMQAVKGKRTSLERRLSAMLAGMRLRGWRTNVSEIPGKPDILFINERVVIFIDGCFWHGCPYCKRKLPETNKEYWERKIQRNMERAKVHNQKLFEDGWTVIRIWEHELRDPVTIARIRTDIRLALNKPNE